MKSSAMATLSLLILLASGISSVATADQPHIVQTACNTLSIDPPLVRIEFSVVNPTAGTICEFGVGIIEWWNPPTDSCLFLECAGPPGWNCFVTSDSVAVFWITADEPTDIGPGETEGPFSFVVVPPVCCYVAEYFTCGIMEPDWDETGCYECDKPIQVHDNTWGELKAIYR
jgi:hypothetical protein